MLQVKIDKIVLKTGNFERELISNVNFELNPNKVYTILGKNGTGKSTLIRSLAKLLDQKKYEVRGSVYFGGKDIYKLTQNEILDLRCDKIKYVFQDAINSFDHLKKLKYYFKLLAKDKNEIEKLLEYFLLPGSAQLYKMHPYEVSGGMAQRISFILALLSHPEIIILDEPTSGIDSAIANLFLLKLKEFVEKDKNSVLLVTQDILFAEKVSDKIAYLANGNLSGFSEVSEFINNPVDQNLKQFLLANENIENE